MNAARTHRKRRALHATLGALVIMIAQAGCGSARSAPESPGSPVPARTAIGPASPAASGAAVQDIIGVHFLTPGIGWASVDNFTRLLMTTDAGVRWRDISPPLLRLPGRTLATGLAGALFLSASDFWVSIGSDQYGLVVVLHTTDGGKTWIRSGSFPHSDGNSWLHFASGQRGWLMVGNGQAMGTEAVTIYQTNDGGTRWAEISRSSSPVARGTPGGPPLNCDKSGISFSGASTAWISGFCNGALALAISTDQGRHWRKATPLPGTHGPDSGGFAYPPIFSSPSDGVVEVGLDTQRGFTESIDSTADGGRTWIAHHPPLQANGAMDVVSASTWFIATGKILYLTVNGGATWTSIASSLNVSSAFPFDGTPRLDFVNARDGWAVSPFGEGARLWHTIDGGRTWHLELLPG